MTTNESAKMSLRGGGEGEGEYTVAIHPPFVMLTFPLISVVVFAQV